MSEEISRVFELSNTHHHHAIHCKKLIKFSSSKTNLQIYHLAVTLTSFHISSSNPHTFYPTPIRSKRNPHIAKQITPHPPCTSSANQSSTLTFHPSHSLNPSTSPKSARGSPAHPRHPHYPSSSPPWHASSSTVGRVFRAESMSVVLTTPRSGFFFFWSM